MTDVPLRDHFEARLDELDRRITQGLADRDVRVSMAMSAAKDALEKADAANERRLDQLNEFRAQHADDARKYALDAVVTVSITQMTERLARCESTLATMQGRAMALAAFGALFGGAAGAVIARLSGS